MIIGILVGLALATGLYVTVLTWRRWRSRPNVRPTLIHRVVAIEPGTEWCHTCAKPIDAPIAHELIDRPQDAVEMEIAAAGGTFVSASFHPGHCPSGARRPHRHAKLPL